MTGLEEETEETVINNTADNIEDTREEKQETPEEQEEIENNKVNDIELSLFTGPGASDSSVFRERKGFVQ